MSDTAEQDTLEPPADEPPADEPPAEEPPGEEPPAETAAEAAAENSTAEEPPCRPTGGVVGWPFLVYLAAWAALSATTAFILTGPDAAAVPVNDPRYPALLLSGITLAALGPVLVLITWAVAFAGAEKGCRGGLLTTALVRGASATLFGVIVWWGALLLVDALRLGLI